MSEDDLTQRATVETIVLAYDRAERQIVAACESIGTAVATVNATLGAVGLRDGVEFGRTRDRYRMDYDKPDEQVYDLRRQLWRAIVERLELRRMMSIERGKELDAWLDAPVQEAITLETVFGLFRTYAEQLPEMLAEAVGEVYEFLRPRRSRLKTNTEYELGERVILPGWVEQGFSGFRRNYYRDAEYRALDNVFSALDGQGQVCKSYAGELADALQASKDGTGETRYFDFRACKNGNLHLRFKRPDLVLKFNRIAGGRRLKHDNEARRQEAAE